MIVRKLKLKLTIDQQQTLERWIWCLTGVWNWAVRKIKLDAHDGVFYSPYDFQNLLANHSDKLDIPSHTIQGVMRQAYVAWQRCFDNQSGAPRLKGKRNRLNSIPFIDSIRRPQNNRVSLPLLGKVRYHSQTLPDAKIKCGRIIRQASGWYLCIWLDCMPKSLKPIETEEAIGIDPGFSTLLTLSNGIKIDNPKELRKGANRLTQSSRSGKRAQIARIQERQANRRQDRNHKISRQLAEKYSTIYYSDDNFRAMTSRFGKSVTEAALGQLISYLNYKCRLGGRKMIHVNSRFTTMTCSACGSLTGPKGLGELKVRNWECACGAQHDRDINAAINVLNSGAGCALKESGNGFN